MVRPGALPSDCFTISLTSDFGDCQEGPSSDYYAQVCRDYGVPFAAVRTISDRADDAAHVDFMAFIRQVASGYSAAVVERYLGR